MDLDNILIFLRVVERGSFTAVARQLRLPLTSVSRRVKKLEEELGVQLLYRTTRRVWVTDAGHAYYERCLRAEEILTEADRLARSHRVEPAGLLRVCLPYTVGLHMIEPRLAGFRRRHPKVTLALTYDNAMRDPIERGFDVALRLGPLADSSYVARRLSQSRSRLAASPDYLERHGRPTQPEGLSEHPVFLMTEGGPSTVLKLANSEGREIELALRPVLTSNEAGTIIRQALAGAGIALVSSMLAHAHFLNGELEWVLPSWHRTPDAELFAVYPPGATSDSKVQAFVDFLVEVFADWRPAPIRSASAVT